MWEKSAKKSLERTRFVILYQIWWVVNISRGVDEFMKNMWYAPKLNNCHLHFPLEKLLFDTEASLKRPLFTQILSFKDSAWFNLSAILQERNPLKIRPTLDALNSEQACAYGMNYTKDFLPTLDTERIYAARDNQSPSVTPWCHLQRNWLIGHHGRHVIRRKRNVWRLWVANCYI